MSIAYKKGIQMERKFFKDYIKFLKTNDNTNLSKIKDMIMPQKLYKFFTDSSYSLNNLFDSCIYLSTPDKFNDPYDTKPLFDPDYLWKLYNADNEIKSFWDSRIGDNNTGEQRKVVICLQQALLKFMSNYRITCFTENNYSNVLMWSHYANSHKGFCIEYDTSDTWLRKHYFLLNPVFYSDKIYDLSECFYELAKNYFKNSGRGCNMIEFLISALVKAQEWSYEKEWRIILLSEGSTPKTIDVDKPKAIYLGLNIEDEQKNKITEFAINNGVPIYQMKQKGNEYKLIPELINDVVRN